VETTKSFTINAIGETTGRSYSGKFTVKTVLTRADRFEADRRRRELLGPNGAEAMPDLQLESFYLGQLAVRIVEAPEWWKDSSNGLNVEDANLIKELSELTFAKEQEAREELKKEAAAALAKMGGASAK
jgi:hypothetical protein